MGHPCENVLGKWKYGPGIQDRFRVRDTDQRVMRVEMRLKTWRYMGSPRGRV